MGGQTKKKQPNKNRKARISKKNKRKLFFKVQVGGGLLNEKKKLFFSRLSHDLKQKINDFLSPEANKKENETENEKGDSQLTNLSIELNLLKMELQEKGDEHEYGIMSAIKSIDNNNNSKSINDKFQELGTAFQYGAALQDQLRPGSGGGGVGGGGVGGVGGGGQYWPPGVGVGYLKKKLY